TLDLPATPTDVDLGDVALDVGTDVVGRVHGMSGPEVAPSWLCLYDRDGIAVRADGLSSDHGRFVLRHVGPGPHRLVVQIVQGGRTFRDRTVVVEGVVA